MHGTVTATAVGVTAAGALREDSVNDDRERKRSERDARKAEKQAAKQAGRDEKEAVREQELVRFGREVAKDLFGGKVIAIYERGFVRVLNMLRPGDFERLVSIEASADVGKKSGLGRGLAAVPTLGVNLLGSNKRGDVYLTIVTDSQTYALRASPPTALNMKASKKLEAAGNAVLRANASADDHGPTSSGVGVRERMHALQSLLADGFITQEEFDHKRQALLDDL